MKKISAILMILFFFLQACGGVETPYVVVTMHPSAVPIVMTMTEIAKTVEVLEQSATAYAATPTPSNTPVPPTNTPNMEVIKNLLVTAIENELIGVLGSKITVKDIRYGPVGAEVTTELYVEINCVSENQTICPSSQVIVAVMGACKGKKKQVKENVLGTTQKLIITIYDPGHLTQVVEVDWAYVIAYIDDEIPPEIFRELLMYYQY